MSQPTSAPALPPQTPAARKPLSVSTTATWRPRSLPAFCWPAHLSFGILESYQKTLLAIVTSILTELILGRIFLGKWLHPASAYITGISVGILVRSPAFWPYALCSAISITSKYVLRVKGRHIWNPSNFGISVMLFLAAETVASLSIQWGNYLLPMLVIWALGSVIIWRLAPLPHHRHLCRFVYRVCVPAKLDDRQSLAVGDRAHHRPHVPTVHLLHDHRSENHGAIQARDNAWSWFLVALLEMVMRLYQIVYAPFYALFIVGPIAMLIEIWLDSRRASAAKPVTAH